MPSKLASQIAEKPMTPCEAWAVVDVNGNAWRGAFLLRSEAEGYCDDGERLARVQISEGWRFDMEEAKKQCGDNIQIAWRSESGAWRRVTHSLWYEDRCWNPSVTDMVAYAWMPLPAPPADARGA